MNNWRRVDEIITYYGKGVTPKYVDDSSIIVLNQKCIRNNKIDFSFAQFIDDKKSYNEDKFLKVGDLLVNSTGQGTAGRVAMVDYIPEGYKIIVDSHILVLRTNDFFESKCLNYSLFSIESLLQTFMDGSTGQGEFDKIRLFNVKVSYSRDNKTQQKMVSVLSALDDKIELNNKINAELEAMAKTLYDYWFVQFEFPNEKGKTYKSSGGKMVYNSILKREIPEGWEVEILDSLLIEFTKGITTSYVEKSNLINLNQKVNKGAFLERQYFKYLDESIEVPTSKFAKKGDVLINSLGQGTLGRVHYFIDYDSNIVVDQHIFILRTNYNKVTSSYLYNTLSSKAYQIQIDRQITGSTGMQMLNASNLKDLQIIKPELGITEKFENIVSKFYDKISVNEKQNQELAQLRDWLLPMLMNGQVTVGNVEDEVLGMVAEPSEIYEKVTAESKEDRFELWLSNQKLAARGDIDEVVLREIFNAMDDEDQ
ncbi:restriction endonuclease subunit S [Sphingobacterium sp. NPDC055346]